MHKLILRFCPVLLCRKGVGYAVCTDFHFGGKIVDGVEHSIQEYWQVYFQELQRCKKLHNWFVLCRLCWHLLRARTQLSHPIIPIPAWESSQNKTFSRFPHFPLRWAWVSLFLRHSKLLREQALPNTHSFSMPVHKPNPGNVRACKIRGVCHLRSLRVPSSRASRCSKASLCTWTASASNFEKIPFFSPVSPDSPVKSSSPSWQMPLR